MADPPSYPDTPRWVKVFRIIAAVILAFVFQLVTEGPHAPRYAQYARWRWWRHTARQRHRRRRATAMTMPPRLRKFALTAHVVSSVGWISAALVFLGLAIIGLTGQDAQTVRGAYLVMEPAAWYVPSRWRSLRCSPGLSKHWAPRGACSGTIGSWRNS